MWKNTLLFCVIATLIFSLYLHNNSTSENIVVGVLQYTNNNTTTYAGFKEGMSAGGYVEGKNITYVFDTPVQERAALIPHMQKILAAEPDLIFVSPTPAARVAKELSHQIDIPVIFAPVNDPVSSGIVKTPERPEGNITGVRLSATDGLRLDALLQIVPTIRRIFIPYTPGDKSAQASLRMLKEASAKHYLELIAQPFTPPVSPSKQADIIPKDVDAVFLPREALVMSHIQDFVTVCLTRKLPLSTPRYSQVETGALTGYGFADFELGRQASRQARRLLEGAAVANVPVETSHDYLFINLETARRIGVTIPKEVMQRADYLVHRISQ